MRKDLDFFAVAMMMLLCLCWGSQQVIIKAGAAEMDPTLQVGARSFLAALIVLGIVLSRRKRLRWDDGTFLPGLLAGVLFTGEFFGVTLALQYTSASHVSVFLYTAPIFTALGLHWLIPEERLRGDQILGVFLAFAGVVAIFAQYGPAAETGDKNLIGDLLAIFAGLSWAMTTIVIRRTTLSEAEPEKALLYQLSVTGILLLAYCFTLGKWHSFSPQASTWLSLAYQTVVICVISFFGWFWLLRKYLASRLSVFSFLTPIFGIFFGVFLLREALSFQFVFGTVMIFTGILLVNGKLRLWRARPSEQNL